MRSEEAGGKKDAQHWPRNSQYQKEDDIDMVNINSINFNSTYSVITANLKTSSNQAIIVKPYKVDTGGDGNIKTLHVYNKLFPRAIKNN